MLALPKAAPYLVLILLLCWLLNYHSRDTSTSPFSSNSQINLDQFKYHRGKTELINTSALFDQRNVEPSIRSLLKVAFGHNQYGSRVIPYFRRRTGSFSAGDVTLVTWLTSDRLGRLISLAEKRRAPISVAYYVPPNDKLASRDLILLDKLYHTHPALSQNVDIHLVTSPHLLQLNTWRTIARTFASTDWILLWDADFEACTDYQKGLERFLVETRARGWADKLEQGTAALIIAPFEWTDPVVERSRDLCPVDRDELVTMYRNLSMDAFETNTPILSHATEYDRWIEVGETDYYEVTEYELGYEAYPLMRRDAEVWFDQRFAGYGYERSAITAQMYLSGMDLYILPGEYGVHQEHSAAAVINTHDDIAAAKVPWMTFKMDLCHTLGEVLAERRVLHQPLGERLVSTCKDMSIPPIDRDIASQLEYSGRVQY
ncbi:hypothetical protein V865_006363 [Kwoniella europaea PYCC6329]|uniref:Uncharacterized protein n=1 Tax=Kwoniella europaea PYCC6329 TaxID=1423913 RepID=A0AAX4KPA8_9TREE